ncbi:MAG TPA: hypothetical protein VFL36_03420 [Myxococcales bacterium]|nr:hypothetical protein [Myxococcales bacterium]
MSSAGATVVQEPDGDASCTLRCSSPGGGWQVRLCAAERMDVRVVSGDCEWLAVLRRDPEIEDSISATPIGAIFHRGAPARLVAAGELPAGAVSVLLDRLQWLGDGPAQVRDGSLSLPLRAGPDAIVPLAAAAERKAAAAAAQIRYLDDRGTLHLVDSRDEVPERYRARAVEVTSSAVTVLHMPPPPLPDPPPAGDPPRPPRDAPPPPSWTPRPARRGPAPYGLTYLEWLRVLSGQRGLGDPDRPACIGNDGKPKQCNE